MINKQSTKSRGVSGDCARSILAASAVVIKFYVRNLLIAEFIEYKRKKRLKKSFCIS